MTTWPRPPPRLFLTVRARVPLLSSPSCRGLIAGDETTEPLTLKDTLEVPADETSEPQLLA